MRPSSDEIAKFLKLVEDLNVFAVIHGAFTTPVPAAFKVMEWLRAEMLDDRN